MGTYATTTTLDLMMVGVNFSATDMATLASKAIEQAESEINKYLSKRYDLSSATFQTSTGVPPLVRSLAERLSEANLWEFLSRGGAGKESLARAREIKSSVVGTKKEPGNLMQIANFEVDLVDTLGSLVPNLTANSSRILSSTSDYPTTFNEDDELSWSISEDKLSDIASERD
jgi:hypothetical protein